MNTTQTPSPSPAIVHEAEVQRQHVRLQLPLSIKVRNKYKLKVLDWSHSGLAFNSTPLLADNITLRSGDLVDTILNFNFDSFSLDVPVTCEVRHVASDGGRIGCRFQNMNERNMSIMHYLVNAYISGDMVQVGDMLDVASRKNFTTPRKVPTAQGGHGTSKAKRIGYTLLLCALSLFVLLYSVFAIYERLYIVESSAGVVLAARGEAGQNRPIVEARISHDEAVRVVKNMPVTLHFPGHGTRYSGTILDIMVENINDSHVKLYIAPQEALPQSLLNAPVKVTIDVF